MLQSDRPKANAKAIWSWIWRLYPSEAKLTLNIYQQNIVIFLSDTAIAFSECECTPKDTVVAFLVVLKGLIVLRCSHLL